MLLNAGAAFTCRQSKENQQNGLDTFQKEKNQHILLELPLKTWADIETI